MLSDSSHVNNAAANAVSGTSSIVTEDWTNGHLVKDSDAYGSSQVTYYPITS